jgi:ATP-binding cassette subfamily B protein
LLLPVDEALCEMDAGNIVERGSHARLIARNGHYAAMGRLQQQSTEAPASLSSNHQSGLCGSG